MSQVYIQKGNKQLRIDGSELNRYLERGFCAINEDGEITQEATSGKTITIEQHNAAIAKLEKIIEEKEAAIAKLESKTDKTDKAADKPTDMAADKADEKTINKAAEKTAK